MRAKVAPLEKKEGCCWSCRGTRSKICKHVVTTETFRSFSTKRECCIKPNNLNCRSNNTRVVLKVFDLDLTIISQPIRISLKEIPSSKCHFTLTLSMTNIMIWVIETLLLFTKQIVETILGEKSLFGSINLTPSNQMDLMSVMWHYLTLLFTLPLASLYFQQFDPLYLL